MIINKLKIKKMALEITDQNFEELVMKSEKPVLVDFWAEWCGPCRMIGPIVEELANEYADKAIVGKVNVDLNPGVSAKFGIRSIPTIKVFENGEVVDTRVGMMNEGQINGILTELING